MSGCDVDLLGMDNCLQMRCNVNHTISWTNSVPMSLCNRLYTNGHVNQWCGCKDPSTLQLLTDTTTLQYRLSPNASLSTTTWKHMAAGGFIPRIFNPGTRRWHFGEGKRPKYSLDRRLGGPDRQSSNYIHKKVLTASSGFKPHSSINQPFTLLLLWTSQLFLYQDIGIFQT